MSIENKLKILHEGEVAWDEVRERRVYNRIQAELDAPTGFSMTLPRMALGTLGGLCAVLLIGFVVYWTISDSSDLGVPRNSIVSNSQQTQNAQSSIMAIGDVGQVRLMSGARVAVLQQETHIVKLQQTQGKAVYEINHRSFRQVFVYVNDVEISVVGTVFTVTLNKELVNVYVDKGVVSINNRNRIVELRSGETLSVAPSPRDSDPEGEGLKSDDSAIELAKKVPLPVFDIDDIETANRRLKDSGGARPAKLRVPRYTKGEATSKRSTKQLFKEVDRARKSGNFDSAARLLGAIIARKDDPASVVSALFVLGKIERARGRHIRAAKVFARCNKLASRGPLAEDALAEAAATWSASGNPKKAKKAAQRYLVRYPRGIHTERMNLILE